MTSTSKSVSEIVQLILDGGSFEDSTSPYITSEQRKVLVILILLERGYDFSCQCFVESELIKLWEKTPDKHAGFIWERLITAKLTKDQWIDVWRGNVGSKRENPWIIIKQKEGFTFEEYDKILTYAENAEERAFAIEGMAKLFDKE